MSLPAPCTRAGLDPLARFLEIQPFVLGQFPREFVDVTPEHIVRVLGVAWPVRATWSPRALPPVCVQPDMLALIDECISLHPSMGAFANDFPLVALNLAVKAELLRRIGDMARVRFCAHWWIAPLAPGLLSSLPPLPCPRGCRLSTQRQLRLSLLAASLSTRQTSRRLTSPWAASYRWRSMPCARRWAAARRKSQPRTIPRLRRFWVQVGE